VKKKHIGENLRDVGSVVQALILLMSSRVFPS